MMKIVIDARCVTDHFPGIGRYTYNLLHALSEIDHGHQLLVLHNLGARNSRFDLAALGSPRLQLVAVQARPFSLAEHYAIPGLLRQLRADLLHAPYYVRPYYGLPCPVVTTLYDAIPHLFPAEVSFRARVLFDLLTRLAVRTSQRVITISRSARADLIAAYGIEPQRIDVTLLAADSRFQPQSPASITALRRHYALPERYILCVSSNKPHKNLPRLIEAWAHVARSYASVTLPTLVMAGNWDAHYPEARTLTTQFGLGERVRFLANVRDEDLPALYAGCEFFVFPSRYEGFGLPPLEAMACGAAVVCGSTSSLPEVVGDAALKVDVTNVAALGAGLTTLLTDLVLLTRLRMAAPQQAAHFAWRRAAAQTLAIYEAAVGVGEFGRTVG